MTQTEPTIQVNDLNAFVELLAYWHERKVNVLEHMLKIPQGFEVTIDDGAPQALTGDLHAGFLLGLNVALSEFGVLPFAAEFDDDAPTPADCTARESAD